MIREIDEINDNGIVLDDGELITYRELGEWLGDISREVFKATNLDLPNGMRAITEQGVVNCAGLVLQEVAKRGGITKKAGD